MKKAGVIAAGLIIAAVIGWLGFQAGKKPAVNAGQIFDEQIAQLPSVEVIKEQEPAAWQKLRAQVLAMQDSGKTEQQILDAVQPEILRIQMSRLQQAPDSHVVAYMKINMEQTAAMQKISDDACFRFLFPAVKGGVNALHLLPHDMVMRRGRVDAQMMKAAMGPDRHTVTDNERQQAQRDILRVAKSLNEKYGQDMELMTAPQRAAGKEMQVCNMVQALWQDVLALPEAEAAGVIRLSVADSN